MKRRYDCSHWTGDCAALGHSNEGGTECSRRTKARTVLALLILGAVLWLLQSCFAL